MLKSKVGFSTNENSYASGYETAVQSIEDLKAPKLSFLFTSCKSNIKEVVKGINEAKIEQTKCPECGKIINKDAKFCDNCGKKM